MIGRDVAYQIFGGHLMMVAEKDPPEIVVVLITNGDLLRMEKTWPISHRDFSDIIDRIVDTEPRGLFVNFFFLDRRDDGFEDLKASLIRAPQWVDYFVLPSPEAGGVGRITPEIKKFYFELEEHNVQLGDARVDRFERLTTIMPAPNGPISPVAALLCGRLCEDATLQDVTGSAHEAGVDVIWRERPPHCAEPEELAFGWFRRALYILAHGAFPPPDQEKGVAVSHIQTAQLPYCYVTWSQLRDARTYSTLSDKYVFVGAALAGASDFAYSPIYISVPGVMGHAAYFDNLFTLGPKVIRNSNNLTESILYQPTVILILAICMMCVRIPFRFSSNSPGSVYLFDASTRCSILSGAALVFLSITISLVELFVWRVSPETWFVGPQMIVYSALIGKVFGLNDDMP